MKGNLIINTQFRNITTFKVDAGWRQWMFLQVELDNGLCGISEFTDSNGSINSLLAAIGDIRSHLIGIEFTSVDQVTSALRRRYRQSLPGIMWKAISAVENALWDLLSKVNETPIHEYFHKDFTPENKFASYWSHCPTTRVRASEFLSSKPVRTNQDLIELGSLIRDNKFTAIKTNLVSLSPTNMVFMPGFNKNFSLTQEQIPKDYEFELSKILDLISQNHSSLEFIIDFNYNLTFNEFTKIQDILLSKKIKYLEIDFDNYEISELVLNNSELPICTGENILGLWNYMPIINDNRVQIISIDLLWNGLSESFLIAKEAIKKGKRIAIHNYYGGLATSMALTFLSLLPIENLELVEFDFDDVPWRDEIVSNPVTFKDGFLSTNFGLGWSNELNLQAIDEYLNQNRRII